MVKICEVSIDCRDTDEIDEVLSGSQPTHQGFFRQGHARLFRLSVPYHSRTTTEQEQASAACCISACVIRFRLFRLLGYFVSPCLRLFRLLDAFSSSVMLTRYRQPPYSVVVTALCHL